MFLSMLNSKQKDMFRELCVYLINVDNDVDEREVTMLQAYCDEMGIPFSEKVAYNNMDDLMKDICEISSESEKRIIAFELIGIVYADQLIKDEEYDCISTFSEISGIPATVMKRFEKSVKDIYTINSELINIINNV